MFFNNISNAALIVFSVTLVTNLAYKFYCKKKNVKREINEVIMFSNEPTLLIDSKYSRRNVPKSIDRLLHYLNLPRLSLDICMYMITNSDIVNIILKQHYRGVKIRVIMDADLAFSSGSAFQRLHRQGIPVRWTKSSYLMHHKFCLIDSSPDANDKITVPFMIMGSLNWTNQGLFGNWEDVIVTSQCDLLWTYKTEFEKLWLQFKPIVEYK